MVCLVSTIKRALPFFLGSLVPLHNLLPSANKVEKRLHCVNVLSLYVLANYIGGLSRHETALSWNCWTFQMKQLQITKESAGAIFCPSEPISETHTALLVECMWVDSGAVALEAAENDLVCQWRLVNWAAAISNGAVRIDMHSMQPDWRTSIQVMDSGACSICISPINAWMGVTIWWPVSTGSSYVSEAYI